ACRRFVRTGRRRCAAIRWTQSCPRTGGALRAHVQTIAWTWASQTSPTGGGIRAAARRSFVHVHVVHVAEKRTDDATGGGACEQNPGDLGKGQIRRAITASSPGCRCGEDLAPAVFDTHERDSAQPKADQPTDDPSSQHVHAERRPSRV